MSGADFVSPALLDVVIALAVAEAAGLMLWRGRRDGRRGARAAVLAMLPGLCLMLAVRQALAGAAWPWVPAALAAALLAHVADLRMRWGG